MPKAVTSSDALLLIKQLLNIQIRFSISSSKQKNIKWFYFLKMKTKTNKIGFVSINFGHVVDPMPWKKYLNGLVKLFLHNGRCIHILYWDRIPRQGPHGQHPKAPYHSGIRTFILPNGESTKYSYGPSSRSEYGYSSVQNLVLSSSVLEIEQKARKEETPFTW